MITLQNLNTAYIDLYSEFRNYVWPLPVIECLADLEVAVYNRFPDMQEVITAFNRLVTEIKSSEIFRSIQDIEYDEDSPEVNLQTVIDDFGEILDQEAVVYSPLQSLTPLYDEEEQPLINTKEEISDGYQDNKNKEAAGESQLQGNKELFNIKHISKSSANRR